MNKFLKQASGVGLSFALPFFAFAQYQVNSLGGGFSAVIDIINRYIIPLIIGLAVVWFLWGVLQYVTAGGDEEKRGNGRNTMLYGIVAIFVMISVWGLVNVLGGTLGLNNQIPSGQIPVVPQTR